MKILAHVHGYPPTHNAGAEHMLKAMCEWLVSRGHQVRVNTNCEVSNVNGVEITPFKDSQLKKDFDWCDVAVSHLNETNRAILFGMTRGKKLVWIAHNSHPYPQVKGRPKDVAVVYNSDILKEKLDYPNKSCVVVPPVFVKDYEVAQSKKKYVTLINLNQNKGGAILETLAKNNPNVEFLGVKGGYDAQICSANLPNLTYWPIQADIRKVYEVTKILLVPSKYESWGRVAIEAGASGIPVIANPTYGLNASLGDAATFIDRKNIPLWGKAIEQLLSDKKLYKQKSTAIRERAVELEKVALEQLVDFEKMLQELSDSTERRQPSGEVQSRNTKIYALRNFDANGMKIRGNEYEMPYNLAVELSLKGLCKIL